MRTGFIAAVYLYKLQRKAISMRMTHIQNFVFLTFALFISQAFALDAPSSKPAQTDAVAENVALVPWNSEESAARLARARHKADFFTLANNFVSQENAMWCGPASAAIVLNSLRLGKKNDLPVDKSSIGEKEDVYLPRDYNPYFEKYTQRNLFKEGAKSKIEILGKPVAVKGDMKSDSGIQLRQLAALLSMHGLDVQLRIAGESLSDETIKAELIANLSSPDDYVLVNFTRKALGQMGGGHISPVAAYDDESDSFLVMDVNPNRASWVWVKTKDLIAAMRTFDTVENRGYLLISESRKS
jgi:hypothetical protein